MRILIFGAYDREYARNRVLRLGLQRLGVQLASCHCDPRAGRIRRLTTLLSRYVRSPPADLVLVPEFRHKDVPLARLLCALAGRPLVVDPLVSRYDTKVGDWGTTSPVSLHAGHNFRTDRAAMRFADLVLADTPQHAAYFQSTFRVPPERTAVVPVGFDDTVLRSLPPPAPGPFRVGFFGSYLPLHGVGTILGAAARLQPEGVRFLLVGSGQTYSAVEEARMNGLSIEVEPTLAPTDLVERLRTCHVLLGIFGTSAKATRVVPNKVYQGLALGRPVVTADTPAIRSFFVPGTHLVTVPGGDAAALAAALRDLRSEPEARARIAAAGARYVHAAFNPEAVARTFLAAVERTLGSSFQVQP